MRGKYNLKFKVTKQEDREKVTPNVLTLVWGQKPTFGALARTHTNGLTAEQVKQVTKGLTGLISATVTFYPNLLVLGTQPAAMFPQMIFLDTMITKH